MKRFFFKIAVIIVTLYGIMGFLILPYYLQFTLSKTIQQQLSIKTYIDRIDFNPFSFELRVDGFILEDQKRKNLLFFETLYLNLELFSLLQNKIHFKEMKVDNFRADIDLDKKQTPNFQFLLELIDSKEATKKEKDLESKLPALQIDQLNLSYLNILFTDNSKKEPYTLVTTPFNINLENISIDTNHTNNIHFQIDTKESGTITLDSKLIVNPFEAEGDVKLSNINLNKKFDYLKTDDIKFDLNSKRLNLDLRYKFEILKENMALNLSQITLDVAGVDISKDKYSTTLKDLKTKVKSVDLNIATELSYKINEVSLDIKTIDFEDKNINNSLQFKELDIDVKQFTSKKDEEIEFRTSLEMPKKGSLNLKGKAIQEPLQVVSDINLEDTTLQPYEKYLQQFVNLGIDSFFINLNSSINYHMKEEKANLDLKANAILNNISIRNIEKEQKILDIKKVDIKDITYKNNFLNLSSVNFEKPFIYVSFNEDKSTNFSKLVKETSEKEQKEESKAQTQFGFMVKKLTVNNGKADIVDKTITPVFNTKEEKINIQVVNLTLNPKERTKIFHKSIMDKYSTVNAQGELKLEDPLDDLVVSLELQNIDLPSLSSYSGKFIGNKLANGKLSLDLQHTIKDGQLNSTNNIRIKDIELGEKVESKDAIDAPIGLAIALLEDSKGIIDLDIPMSGDVKSPKFDISDAISDVIVNTIVGIVTAPFKFLAILTGLDGEQDISNTGFAYGSSMIDPTQKEKLDTIAKALINRPQLQIKIQPAYSLEHDKQVLIEKRFQKAYPLLSDTSKKFQELYSFIKEQFIKLYSDKEYENIKGKEDEKYPYMVAKLKQTIKVTLLEIENLAKNRAIEVQNYLIAHGVEKNRIMVQNSYSRDKVDKKLNQVIVLFELDAK